MSRTVRTFVALVIAVLTIVPSVGQANPAHPWVCAGNAPETKSCSELHEIAVVGAALVIVEPAFGGYTGRIRIQLLKGTVAMVDLYCDYVGDAAKDFTEDVVNQGANNCKIPANNFPKEGDTFTQKCFSYNVGTFTLGGKGAWMCGVLAA